MNLVEFDYSFTLSRLLPLRNDDLFCDLLSHFRDRIEPGWSLNPYALRASLWSLEKRSLSGRQPRVVEFGSGLSSLFLRRYFGSALQMTSFEHDCEWTTKLNEEDATLDIQLRTLLSFSFPDFQNWIYKRLPDWETMRRQGRDVSDGQKHDLTIPNAFYALDGADVPAADLYIVDGPHGHGRSISFRLIDDAREGECDVLIDDVNHYPFLHDASWAFKYNVLHGEFLPQKRWVLLQLPASES